MKVESTISRTYCHQDKVDSIKKQLQDAKIEIRERPTMSNGFHATEITAVVSGRGAKLKISKASSILYPLS